jgi:hypothetical protein
MARSHASRRRFPIHGAGSMTVRSRTKEKMTRRVPTTSATVSAMAEFLTMGSVSGFTSGVSRKYQDSATFTASRMPNTLNNAEKRFPVSSVSKRFRAVAGSASGTSEGARQKRHRIASAGDNRWQRRQITMCCG